VNANVISIFFQSRHTAKFLQSFTASENTLSVIQAQSIESANEHFFLNIERHTVPASSEMQYEQFMQYD